MSENFETATMLLLVGMLTVFFILALVVLTGHFLIMVVNRLSAENPSKPDYKSFNKDKSGPNAAQMAALIAAIDTATGGEGNIEKIEKI
ncbi:MAG TPA: OadG family protein [Saprospiraceae bacterium]|nr:OadG family protein [Saprospiraceae bacterium]